MKINQKTMLFEELTLEEGKEMLAFCESVVLEGKMPHPLPPWVGQWLDAFDYNTPDRALLLLSTAFPQRVMLSLLKSELVSFAR